MLTLSYNKKSKIAEQIASLINDGAITIYVNVPYSIVPATTSAKSKLPKEDNIKSLCDNSNILIKIWEFPDLYHGPAISKELSDYRATLPEETENKLIDLVYVRGVLILFKEVGDISDNIPVLCIPPLSIDLECEHILRIRDSIGLPTSSNEVKLSWKALRDVKAWLNLITSELSKERLKSKFWDALPGTTTLVGSKPGAYCILMEQLKEEETRNDLEFSAMISDLRKMIKK